MDVKQNDTPQPNRTQQSLSSMRSLLINPSTPQRTVSSILETLTHSPELTHHAIKLLSDLATHHPSHSQLVFESLLSATDSPTRLSVEALASISEHRFVELEDGVFLSLCFGPSVPARLWMLRNAGLRFGVRPALLLAVFLGFTKDPYPYVRAASLEGLVGLSERGEVQDLSLVEACYRRAVQLLRDMEDCVRLSAVRAVASWGRMLADSTADMKACWSNEVFAKLCSMARDMSMKVRVEAFNGLGKMEMVSEDFLMQSLSKRVSKQREIHDQGTSEQFVMLATSVAGALVHGLEDEFFEVRKSTCQSLMLLTRLSVEFAREALNYLMDVLNDDSAVVRLQALETMHHMAISGCLKLQEKHMHMFLGALVDSSKEIRYTERKILLLVKLKDLTLFKLSVDGLLENLDRYPQDEADVFSAFSHLGRNHKKFVGLIVKEIFVEVEAAFGGKLEFNSARIAALLILSISAPLLNADVGSIPPILFSYAVTFLGRICNAFSDVMDRDDLLAYLCEKSKSMGHSEINNLKEGEKQLPSFEGKTQNFASNEVIDSEIESQITREPKEVTDPQIEPQQSQNNEVINFTNYIIAKSPDMWQMIQSGYSNEVLRSFRCLKEELALLKLDSLGSGDTWTFTLLYLRIIKLLAEVWEHLLPTKRLRIQGMGELEFILGKLDRRIAELVGSFTGYSSEEELNVLELALVTYVLRLCKVEFCRPNFALKRLTALYSRVESAFKEGSTLPSEFVVELGKLLHENSSSMNGASCSPLQFDKCLKLFSLKQFAFRGTFRHIRAELSITNTDSVHPLPFVSGLPAGIPCEITLHSVSSESRLWLRMSMDNGLTQYAFLDLDRSEDSGEVKKFAFVAPFYKTPKASLLTLKVCVGLECLFENARPVQGYGGPKHGLVLLCKEKQVYLSKVDKK